MMVSFLMKSCPLLSEKLDTATMGLWSYTPGSLSMRGVGAPRHRSNRGEEARNERAPNISEAEWLLKVNRVVEY